MKPAGDRERRRAELLVAANILRPSTRQGRPAEDYGYCRHECRTCPGFGRFCVGYPERWPVESWPEPAR